MLSIKIKDGKASVSVDGVALPEISSLEISCADGSSRVALEIINGDVSIEHDDDKAGHSESLDTL